MEKFSGLGYAGIFATVFLEQIGVPIPAFPLLIAVGAFVASGRLQGGATLVTAVSAAMLADVIWYSLGKAKGASILNLICRISWKPDTCISTTKGLFGRYGAKTLLFSKFIPGLSTIAPPLAGIVAIPWRRFLWYNGLGCVIWAGLPLGLGFYFRQSIPSTETLLGWAKQYLPLLAIALIGGFILWRLFKRWLYRRDLMQELSSGISVENLKRKMDDNVDILVLDIRHPLELHHRPMILSGARHIGHHELEQRLSEISLDREIVVYCDCPHDEGAVEVVKLLRKKGAKSVRPLLGGLRRWEELGFATGTSETVYPKK